ncbi:S41 family peptidase [Arenimonas composti]|uniref:Tail specific protease domain-containing protein n=1 Tax=Arenimonas composti TR7-09 = DSM 18010 TaxID=1121013 RepID=A0A091BV68_9GAMM|nr:S41 family peptidase [Arenimonas composti]KFN48235.1 hypothetical protein P873_01375 [Arenimonas composti TR7-09 = DSM 18010]
MTRIALLLLLLMFTAVAGARPPRETVDAVAIQIEDYYWNAERGAEIAATLRNEAAAGRYDAHTAAVDLATALTARLQPLDRHFHVRWAPPGSGPALPPPPGAGPPPGPPPGEDEDEEAFWHGLRSAQVLPGNIGYLDMGEFAHIDFEDPNDPARAAIDAALTFVQWTDAVVIDLRDNGGGSPAMVGYLSSAFTRPGSDIFNTFVMRERRLSEAPEVWHPAPRLDVPLYVLTSGRTGSAAEAFAYTVANAGRATVVGERSVGAANPGRPFDAGEGFSVFVSTGSPINPVTGSNWEGDGVIPAIEVPARDALQVAQVHALEAYVSRRGADTPMGYRWVLEALKAPRESTGAGELAAYVGEYGQIRVALENGNLMMYDRRRPARTLRALGNGVFFDVENPLRRVAFEREGGQVVALEVRFSEGGRSRYPRGVQDKG